MSENVATKSDIRRLEGIMIAATDGFKRRQASLRTELRRGFARVENVQTAVTALQLAVRTLDTQVNDLAARVFLLEKQNFNAADDAP